MTDDEAISHLTARGYLVLPREPTRAVTEAIGRALAHRNGHAVQFVTEPVLREQYHSEAEELWRRAWRV